MARWPFLGLTLLLGTSILIFISCGDDESPTEPEPLAANLSVQPAELDFGVRSTELPLLVTNTGGGTLTWECNCGAANVSYQPAEGSIATATEVDTISVVANREGLGLGSYADTLAISSNGGTVRVPVSVSVGLTPLPSVLGEYEGIYAYTTDYGSANEHATEYPITWRFTDLSYHMWNAPGSEDALCEPSGNYVLDIGVELIQREEGCSSETSEPEMNPTGFFSLMQPEDSVIMIQIDGSVRKDIRLAPLSE